MSKKYFSRLSQILYQIQISDFGCWCNYHKFGLIISVIVVLFIFSLFGHKPISYSKEIISLYVGMLSAIVAFVTYDGNRKMETLASYNERFCMNEIIKNITKIIDKRIAEKGSNNHSVTCDTSVVFDQQKEMFYRFFEELELNIQKGILKKRDVYNLFAYYALEGICKNLLPLSDYPNNWRLLERFIKRMESFESDRKSYC